MNSSRLVRSSSAWNKLEIEQFLRDCKIPIRLACLNNEDKPLVCSLWYLYDGSALWCATQKTAAAAQYLERSPEIGFEISPEAMPYRGVRGQGKATIIEETGTEVLLQLMDRYLGERESKFAQWLIKRSATEIAIRIDPEWLNSWDFGQRMKSK